MGVIVWLVIWLFYQDINEQFGGYTQQLEEPKQTNESCFIRISMNNLEDIHNRSLQHCLEKLVVLSGYQ